MPRSKNAKAQEYQGKVACRRLVNFEDILSLEGLDFRPSGERFFEDFSGFPAEARRPRRHITLPLHLLTRRQREVIFCLFYDALTEEETALVLGISRRSVRTHRARALAKLRRATEGNKRQKP